MKIVHQGDRVAHRRAELPPVESQLDALWEILLANKSITIPATARTIVDAVAAKRKYPQRGAR